MRRSSYVKTRLMRYLLACLILLCTVVSVAGAQDADPVVARVNGHEIRLSYVYKKVESLPLGEQVDVRDALGHFVESVVQEEILFQSMARTDFQAEPELRERVKTTVAEYLIEKYVKARQQVSDEAIQAYYRDNESMIRGESVRVRHILRPTSPECEALQQQIDSEATFIRLAATHSLDRKTAPQGGDLGHVMRHPGALGFEPEWFTMQPGEMRIFESSQGCHLVRVAEHSLPPLPPLEQVRERIRFVLQRNQEIKLLRSLIAERSRDMIITRIPIDPQ